MLKEILSITGKPGLFKLVSQGKNMLIVESLTDGKRGPVYSHDKAVSLGDIAIFTETDEIPLAEVFQKIKEKENEAKINIDLKADNDTLRKYIEQVIPNYDKDRVYPSDIRKMISWYNTLVSKNLTDFSLAKEDADDDKTDKEAKEFSKPETKSTMGKKEPKIQAKQPKIAQKSVTNRKMGG